MSGSYKNEVVIPIDSIQVNGDLALPEGAKSIVIFAHGSGSSRFSPRNQMVASYLQQYGLGTFLFDLLTREEDMDRQNRFNIELLAKRLLLATEWLQTQDFTRGIYYSYFGASTGAAAALIAASVKPHITAVVSRGGRPDLALESLASVKAPVLLIVGSRDTDVIRLNQKAFDLIISEKKLVEVEGATHLFEEPGKMEEVCRLSADWLGTHATPVF